MMGVYIKGMEMPQKGYKTVIIHSNGEVYEPTNNDLVICRIANAVELPPHGDLIDRDAIAYVQSEDGVLDDYAYRYDINELPVIIPAEKEVRNDA